MTAYIPEMLMMQSGLKYNEDYLPGIGIHAPRHDEAIGYARFGHLFLNEGNLGQEIYILSEEEILIIHCGNSLEYYNSDLPGSAVALIKKNK